MDYPEFEWFTPASQTPEAVNFRKQFVDTFRSGAAFNNRPPSAVTPEPETEPLTHTPNPKKNQL